MRFEIVYKARYDYPSPVTDSLNSLRIKPAVTQGQAVESFDLRVSPDARVYERRDYFGTEVIEFEIDDPHGYLDIASRAEVVTDEPTTTPEGGWDLLNNERYRSTGGEFLLLAQQPAELEESIREMTENIRRETPGATALAATGVIPARFEYRQGSTFVGSTISDLFEGGAGVCQDFVHLGLVLLRRLDIAARYVSGYLFAAPAEGGQESVEVQTHAWLEALLPSEDGGEPRWVAFDPTNGGQAGETHVKIGHGRSYGDVPPIRGIYRGPASDDVLVAVQMRRINGAGA